MDSDPDSERHRIFPTMAKIVEDAFSHTMTTEKWKGIKRRQPIPDTPHTKVPKLNPTIQSRMTPQAKALDRNPRICLWRSHIPSHCTGISQVWIPEYQRYNRIHSTSLKVPRKCFCHVSVERCCRASS